MREEKQGKIIINGNIIDLDSTPAVLLEEYLKDLRAKEEEIEFKIDSILLR